MKDKILKLIKKYGLSDHLKKQTPIENGSLEWHKIIEISGEIEIDEVEKNNLQKENWIEDEKGITNTEKGTHFYFEIEDEVMSYFKIVDMNPQRLIKLNRRYK
jgi:predicted transcriptional regulator